MRLLELKNRGEFSLTRDLVDNIPPYAILSHTWGEDDEEATFQDLTQGVGKSKASYRKIRFCQEQATRDGLQYVWVDTCCIDKSNNTELSEAINSMFRWYREAAKCYVYLSDVSTQNSDENDYFFRFTWESAFRKSRWFTRGWTLQELIAPVSVEFFSGEGKRLGDKKSIEQQVHEITGIPINALQGSPLSHFSVSERISWAENRDTKRKEDKAYSLMGIFDIHMPLIYGEGRESAFIRLHDEIDKRSRNFRREKLPNIPQEVFEASWQLAVGTHLSSLTALQKAAFIAPANADDCMKLIAKSHRVRGFSQVQNVMRPIIDPLRRFEVMIGVLVQTNSGLCSPIWGPLRFAITVASDHVETIEKLARILQRIVASLERHSNYEILFKNNLNTQRAIGALYSDLIDLCTRVVRFHSRSALNGVFVSFDKEFQQVSDNITHHSTEIDWAANAANIEEAKKARGIEDTARSSQMRANVQKWLCPANVQDDLYRHQRDCMTGSCNWALEMPDVQPFLSSEISEILRIGGAPGSGKSTLVAFLIGYITRTTTNDVLYFFCKGTDEKKNRPFQVLRTLVSQILAKDESLYPWFETLHQQSGRETAESFASLHSSFQLALRNTSKPLIFIVVDALDECEEAKDLVFSMMTAAAETQRTIKILITCREDPELLDSFNRPISELKIFPDRVKSLVFEYIQERVSKCKHISGTALGSEVHKKVAKAAAGLWLSARLIMDEIQRLPSSASIARQLQDIPIGIVELYQQIFSTMEGSFSPLQLRLSQQVFLWIDMADFVQVGRQSLDRELLDLIFQAENGGEEVFNSIDLARQLCSPLIEWRGNEDGEIEVEFVHHTTAQFVRMCGKERTFQIPRILEPQQLKALYRGNTSVWFFEESPKADWILRGLRFTPPKGKTALTWEYFEMAYGLWDACFLKELPPSLDADEIIAASRLCDKLTEFLLSGRCLKWIEMAIIINYAGWCKLYENAVEALDAAYDGLSSPLPFFRRFSMARTQFFTDYTYVLSLTGPTGRWQKESLPIPEGFDTRRVAGHMASCTRSYAPRFSSAKL